MTEFTKTKMHFTLALLGTLFALHPVVEKIDQWGFFYEVFGQRYFLKVFYVYALLAGLLALTVYCFAVSLRSEHSSSWVEKLGNYAYGLAIIVLPLYGGLYLASLLGDELADTGWGWAIKIAPWVPLGLGIFWLLLSQVLALWVRKRLSAQDRKAKAERLAEQETVALNRALEMFGGSHYDLAVIESWKALEARLRRSLLLHGRGNPGNDPENVVNAAARVGLLNTLARKQVDDLLRQWHIAVGTEPVTKEAAQVALQTTRDVLATVPIAVTKAA